MSFKTITTLLGNRVGIEVLVKRRWSSIIAAPPGSERKTDQAIVRYLGESYTGPVKLGDLIIYDRYNTTEIKVDNDPIYLSHADDLIAIIEDV